MKRNRLIILIIILIVLVGGFFVVRGVLLRPSLNAYQKEFGFSTKGLKVKIEKYYNNRAFQGSGAIYIAKIEGSTEGTVFDSAEMQQGIPGSIKDAIQFLNTDAQAEGKDMILKIENEDKCKSRILPSVNAGSRAKLDIVFDESRSLYYVIWQSW